MRTKRIMAGAALFAATLGISQAASFSSWGRQLEFQFSGYGRASALTNFPALVVLGPHISGFSYADFASGANADLRFTDGTRTNELPYEIEQWNTNGSSSVWVQLPQLTNSANLWAFWGKSGQAAPASTTNGLTWAGAHAGVWHFGETNGAALDSTSNAVHGTLAGSAARTASGRIGQGMQWPASTVSDHVSLGTSDALGFTDGMTILAWVKTSAGGSADIMARFKTASAWQGYDFNLGQVGAVGRLSYWGGHSWIGSSSGRTFNDGAWHLLGVVHQPDGTVRFYADGAQDGSAISEGGAPTTASGNLAYLGRSSDGARPLTGTLDEVRISGSALSPDWIWASFMNQASNDLFASRGAVAAGGLADIRTDPPADVTGTSATLNGYLTSTGTSATAVYVYYGPTDGGADAANWAATNTSLTAPQGLGSKSVTVALEAGGEYFYRFAAVNAEGPAWADASSYFLTTNVAISAVPATVGETNAVGTFWFVRPAALTGGPVTVRFTLGGTAINGTDYSPVAATSATMAPGATSATLQVTTLTDAALEGDETIELTETAGAYVLNAPATASLTLADSTRVWYVATNGNEAADGLSWGTALASISNAVAKAADYDIILVTNGIYRIGAQITLAKTVTVQSVNGALVTSILPLGSNYRLLNLYTGAVVDGFTLANAFYDTSGGGIYFNGGGTVKNCVITNHYGQNGGAAYMYKGGLLDRCVIRGNGARGGAGVQCVQGGVIRNCLITGNRGNSFGYGGGGVRLQSGGLVESCTISGNSTVDRGGGVYCESGGVLTNTIVYGNTVDSGNGPNYVSSGGSFAYCCALPLAAGTGNTTNNPLFLNPATNDYRLGAGSSCTNTGVQTPWMAGAKDLAGRDRVLEGRPDIGAYESQAGALACSFVADVTEGLAPLQVTFTATVAGTNTAGLYYEWDYTNDAVFELEGEGLSTATTPYPAGTYTVSLTVTNAAGETATYTRAGYIKAGPAVAYVVPSGTPSFPYTNWATAATNLQAAVDAGVDGTAIWVTNGTYRIAQQVTIAKALALRSVEGAGKTAITLQSGNNRLLYLSSTGAVVDGFTIANANYSELTGAGVYCYLGGTVMNCVITNNFGHHAAGAQLERGGLLDHCTLSANRARGGGGVQCNNGGTLRNCLLYGNRANNSSDGGGAIQMIGAGGLVESCTISGNSAADRGGGIYCNGGGTVTNTILFGNTSDAANGHNYYNNGGSFAYSCLLPLIAGTGNTTNNPLFVNPATNNYRLGAGSSCTNAAAELAWMAAGKDLDGHDRIIDGKPDIGAYEFGVTALECSFLADTTEGLAPLQVVFTASVVGPDLAGLTYRWDFDNNGTFEREGSDLAVVTNSFAAGLHSVSLTVINAATETAIATRLAYIRAAPAVAYVALTGAHAYPYTNWATAATNLQAAVDAGTDGTLVWVTNGLYGTTQQVAVARGITLRSVNGAAATVLKRVTAVGRALYLASPSAVVDGFTITGANDAEVAGAGVYCYLGGTVMNCVISNNLAHDGGGAWLEAGGLLDHCVITANRARGGGGVQCNGGGTVRNCLVAGNSLTMGAPYGGGGVYCLGGGTVESCTIVTNVAVDKGGGVYCNGGGTVRNTILALNAAPNGAEYNSSGGTFSYSCATPLPAGPGNLANSPVFRSVAAGDFRLDSSSAGMDAGTNLAWMAGAVDLAGTPRIVRRVVDMGAYEDFHVRGTILTVR